ncbi:hypothetical protein [[Acholeplasma] multilocale]|uniref:hypothetical protein n=1 Tax=[Acholeplasma] multilocale TaxID=264638 RepID=UPI0004792395|nr:hypothetical protein [[Acholeplasma] multilocale]
MKKWRKRILIVFLILATLAIIGFITGIIVIEIIWSSASHGLPGKIDDTMIILTTNIKVLIN